MKDCGHLFHDKIIRMNKYRNLIFFLTFWLLSCIYAEASTIAEGIKLRQDSVFLNQYVLPGINKADSLLTSGDFEDAIHVAQVVIDSIGNDMNYIETTSRAYFIIARANKELHRFGISLKNYLQSLQSLKILGDRKSSAKIYLDLGQLYEDWGLKVKAIEYYQNALDYRFPKHEQASLLNKIAGLYADIRNYNNAVLYLSRLLKLYNEPADESKKLEVLNNLTINYNKLKKYDKAIVSLTQILQIQTENSDARGRLLTINRMAHAYLNEGKYSPAMKYFDGYIAEIGNKKPENMDTEEKEVYAGTKMTFGKIMEDFGDKGEPDNYHKALKNYEKALELYVFMNDQDASAQCFYLIANIYHKLRDYKNTIINCDNSILLADANNNFRVLMNAYNLLSESYENIEKYKQAIWASRQYSVYKDSVYRRNLAEKIEEIKIQSDYNNNEAVIHRIEQMIAEEEMSNLAITRLELQDERNKQEIDLLAKEKKLQEYSLKTEQLEKEKALNDLQLVHQQYEAMKKDREIENLQKDRDFQALAQKDRERDISMLKQEKQLNKLKLQKANAQRYILFVTVFLTIIVLVLMIRSYIQTRRSKEKIAAINAEIAESNIKLKELNEEKNRLIRIVAHDLRNPLTNAITLTGLLKNIEAGLNREYAHSLQLIRKSLLRMHEMIIKILDIKAINEEKINLEMEAINLKQVIVHLTELYQDKIRHKNIQLIADLEEIYVMADRNYIFQILENLLSNAIKFSERDRTIRIRVTDFTDKCRFIIKDEGPGFTEHDQALMFTEYQRLSSRPTGGERSTGIGLSIVKKYLDAMNGRIWCESVKGQGATFTIELNKALVEA